MFHMFLYETEVAYESIMIFTGLFWFTFVLILNVKFRFPLLVFYIFIQLFEVWSKGTPVFLRDNNSLYTTNQKIKKNTNNLIL